MTPLADRFASLTEREHETVVLLCLGHTRPSIAAQLRVDLKTIDTHRLRACAKIGVKGNLELYRAALLCGFASIHDTDFPEAADAGGASEEA